MDNLPNTMMEAMVLGKIVISSDATSGEQLITDSENGFLTKVDDKEIYIGKFVWQCRCQNKADSR